MTTKAERDAMEYWCEEHNRWFVGREGCPGEKEDTDDKAA